ncbi:hypothetical protein HMPREF9554_02762 [Treponema phagedenis F0421]|nr:hypothetical protein HMPREF9554_02762 [Treponema phagedenis F0421]
MLHYMHESFIKRIIFYPRFTHNSNAKIFMHVTANHFYRY